MIGPSVLRTIRGSPMADIEWKPLPEGLWTPPAVFADVGNLCLQAFTDDGLPNLGDLQEERKTGRMGRHRQRYCRLLRGGQSGGALRSGSSIADARYLRLNARSVRRTRNHPVPTHAFGTLGSLNRRDAVSVMF